MQLRTLLLTWALTAAASHDTTDRTAAQQVVMGDSASSSETHKQKTNHAKTMLKVSSDGKASRIPEIAKLAIDVSAKSSTSEEDAIERLGLTILQVEFVLADQESAGVVETYASAFTHIANARDNTHWARGVSHTNGPSNVDSEVEEVKYRAETTFNVRGAPGQAIRDIRSFTNQLRGMRDVRVRTIEWELSETSRDQLRLDAKREALQNCLSHGEETATLLGYTSGVMLLQVEQTHLWVQEKREMRQTVYYPAREEEIDARPKEMEMSVKVSCTFGAMRLVLEIGTAYSVLPRRWLSPFI